MSKPFDACHHCTKRVVGCHSTCKEYKDAQKLNEELKAIANADKDARQYEYGVMIKRYNRNVLAKKKQVSVRRNYH